MFCAGLKRVPSAKLFACALRIHRISSHSVLKGAITVSRARLIINLDVPETI